MDKVQKLGSSRCHTPSSESYGIKLKCKYSDVSAVKRDIDGGHVSADMKGGELTK
jgi:hypothetical protein